MTNFSKNVEFHVALLFFTVFEQFIETVSKNLCHVEKESWSYCIGLSSINVRFTENKWKKTIWFSYVSLVFG